MTRNIRVLGIIPARGGSKRVPRKNLALLAGKPLLSYAIHAAQESRMLDACIVSTDDPEIAAVAKSLGADVPFLRPRKYAQDSSRDIAYVRHALEWLRRHRTWQPEIIVLLPPDTPLRTGRDIDNVVRFLIKEKLDSVRTLAGPIRHPSCKAMWTMKDAHGKSVTPLFPDFVGKPAQEVPPYYLSVGLVYATRARFIKRGNLWGKRIGGYVMNAEKCIEIDEQEQLSQAEALLHKRKSP
ncbi:MAG: acylneuraminate cytidylyltransferase family protein [Candidatus Peribacteraceae bacterium]|nr:acylneuraminate cytidylyltransferase family protein [Candidatus Peribacteraceae bacterium]MDD5075201.1 acylneuraminate cytidylyltransferase family protein [Candidatus Peribacteraceae bacterium]